MSLLRSVALCSLLAAATAFACSSSDGGTPGVDASGDASTGGDTGTPATGDDASSPVTDAGTDTGTAPVAGAISLTVNGKLVDGGDQWQNTEHSGSNISVLWGQAVGTFPKEAELTLELYLDNTKTTTGTFGIEAVMNASGLLKIVDGGTVATQWSPTKMNGMTLALAVDGKSITVSWKGTMTENGTPTTADVDAEAAGAPLK